MTTFQNFHLGSFGGYTSYRICLQEAKHFISHFQCFMVPFHYFHLGSSGGFALYLPFSVLHCTISNALILSLFEDIIFMALFHCRNIGSSKAITLFGILNASWPNSTAFIGFFWGYTPYLPFSVLLGTIPLFSSSVIWRVYTLFAILMVPFNCIHLGSSGDHMLYFSFSVEYDPISLNISGDLWRPYTLFAFFSV